MSSSSPRCRRTSPTSRLRCFIGDVRDRDRLKRAFDGVDFVVHAAALKQVDRRSTTRSRRQDQRPRQPERHRRGHRRRRPEGRRAVDRQGRQPGQPLRRDQALRGQALRRRPTTTRRDSGTTFAVVRYGNVMGSRGSVIPLFRELRGRGQPLPITDDRMTRFWITLPQAVHFVVDSFEHMQGGEMFVPRIPSHAVIDLAEAIAPGGETVRDRHPPRREAARGDDLRGRRCRTIRQDERYVVKPRCRSGGSRSPRGEPVPRGLPLPVATPTTCG